MMRLAKCAIAAMALVAPLAIAPAAQAQNTYCSGIQPVTTTVGAGEYNLGVLYSGSAPVTGALFNANLETTDGFLIATAAQDVGADIEMQNYNPFDISVNASGWDILTVEC